jgi:hypothetical protein
MKNQFKKMGTLCLGLLLASAQHMYSQTVTTNRNVVGMEHNLFFNANNRFTVTQTGSAKIDLNRMFDGNFIPSYTSSAPTPENPTIILIENLPAYHTQVGAYVGWSTRYWPPNRFKIEAFNTYLGVNAWVTVADYSQAVYLGSDFSKKLPSGAYSKLRFTFYSASGTDGRLGISELFYLHPEATTPYYGLAHSWERTGENLFRRSGSVGIGTIAPAAKLHVVGNILATEVKVEAQTADFVFEENYHLKPLSEVEQFINQNKHLPGIPSAKQMEKEGVGLAEMNKLLLQKVEELTLHIIELNKKIEVLETK